MSHPIRLRHVLGAVAMAAAATAAPLASAAHAGPATPWVPADLRVEAGNKVFLVAHAEGVQIYTCTAGGWVLLAPRADLFNDHGTFIATHFAGPTWRAKDGSTVVGRRVKGVKVDPTAVDWLLLSAASTSEGADGDRLSATTFVQRINTVAGLPPAAAECTADALGTAAESPYRADYVFWKATGA